MNIHTLKCDQCRIATVQMAPKVDGVIPNLDWIRVRGPRYSVDLCSKACAVAWIEIEYKTEFHLRHT